MKKCSVIIILLLTFSFTAKGYETDNSLRILYVGESGSGNFTTIQSAIDNASNGDIIFIYKGIYYETPMINKSISIIGEDPEYTIIDGKQSMVNNIFSVNTSYFNLHGVTIQNSSSYKYGIYLTNINYKSIITNCTILTKYGVHIFSSSNITICNCLLQGGMNEIVFLKGNNCTILNCIIAMDQIGIDINLDSNNNTIINCNVLGNYESSYLIYGCSIYSDNNSIYNCSFMTCYDGLSINGNKTFIQNCIFNNNTRRGVSIIKGKNNIISHCDISNNGNTDVDFGIVIDYGLNNFIEDCKISDNGGGGIYFSPWGYNNILNNSVIEQNGYLSNYGAGIYSCAPNMGTAPISFFFL